MDSSELSGGIAVIIPVYNRPTILQETLVSVLKQTLLPDKLIIIDDGSTDDTAMLAEKWLSDHADAVDWQVIRNPKAGAANARNDGFSKIGTLEYVAFLDSDDHWPKDFLERCVKSLEARSDAVATITERRYRILLEEPIQSTGGLEMVSDPIPWIFKNGAGIASCTLLRSAVVREVGAWPDSPTCEDTELFCLMSLKGPWVFSEGDPVVFHMGNAIDRNEAGNLSRKYADRESRWTRRLEEIYQKLLELDASIIDSAPLKASMANRWHRAAKYHRNASEWHEARFCLRRAIHWHPTKWKYWKRLFKVAFKSESDVHGK